MGRPRVLNDEERRQKKKELDSRRVTLCTPVGFKEKLAEFADGRDISEVVVSMINKNPDFRNFNRIVTK